MSGVSTVGWGGIKKWGGWVGGGVNFIFNTLSGVKKTVVRLGTMLVYLFDATI